MLLARLLWAKPSGIKLKLFWLPDIKMIGYRFSQMNTDKGNKSVKIYVHLWPIFFISN